MAKNDDRIKSLLGQIEDQQAKLGQKPKPNYSTNAIFKHKDGTFFNLNTVRDPQVLVDALGTLLGSELSRQEAVKRLNAPSAPVIVDGFTLSEWEGDFRKRVEIILWEEKKAHLDATKKKLKELVSEEAKTEMELDAIQKLLG